MVAWRFGTPRRAKSSGEAIKLPGMLLRKSISTMAIGGVRPNVTALLRWMLVGLELLGSVLKHSGTLITDIAFDFHYL